MVRSVLRALQILQLAGLGEVRVSVIADRLGVDKATAHRLLATLVKGGFLQQDNATRGYRLTHVVASLGYAYVNAFKLRVSGEAPLERLARETGETAMLAVLDGTKAVFVAVHEAQAHAVRLTGRVGEEAPLHASAAGKAILAFRPAEEYAALVGAGPLARYTRRTVTDLAHLKAEVAEIRRTGYALSCGELDDGVSGLGVPILDPNGCATGSLSVAVPDYRFDAERREAILARLRATVSDWISSEVRDA